MMIWTDAAAERSAFSWVHQCLRERERGLPMQCLRPRLGMADFSTPVCVFVYTLLLPSLSSWSRPRAPTTTRKAQFAQPQPVFNEGK